MNQVIMLDTSAWFAVAEAEPGAAEVAGYLAAAWDGRVTLHASFVSLTELAYIRTKEQGGAAAAKLLSWVKEQPVQWHHSDAELCDAAATLKAAYRISFADAFVAATAQRVGGMLVHKDPEFGALGQIVKQQMLPPKVGAASS